MFGAVDDPCAETDGEDVSMYDNESGSTLIYTGEPDLNVSVSDPGGHGSYNAAKLNAITNAEVAKVSDRNPVNGQLAKRPQRGQGVRPRQMPPQPPQQPMPPQQDAYPPQQAYYPPQQPQQQQYYPAQQYYPQQQTIPVQQATSDESIHRVMPNPGEPFSEMIMLNGVYHFYLDLPGVSAGDLQVRYVNMHLVVSGERKLNANLLSPKGKTRGNKGRKVEFEAQVTVPPQLEKFEHAFYFPKPVAPDSFKSSLVNGVLHVEMSILGPATGSGIQISIG